MFLGDQTMSKMFAVGAACLVLIFSLGTIPAMAARDLPSNGLSRSDVVHWLQGHGYKADIEHDAVAKDDYVATSSLGVNWGIYFYACDTNNVCQSIQYSIGWSGATDITHDKLNDWNRDKRYLRAYADTQGAVFAEYDIDINPGGTWEEMDKTLDRWNSQMGAFKTFIGR